MCVCVCFLLSLLVDDFHLNAPKCNRSTQFLNVEQQTFFFVSMLHLPAALRQKIDELDARRASMQAFANEIAAIQQRLKRKQEVVDAVIDRRIQHHHELLDKWRERWKTTVAESLDEKRDKLAKQQARFERKVRKLADFRATVEQVKQRCRAARVRS